MTTCAECRFTQGQSDGASLMCQRYPSRVRVARTYWCGEWKARVEDKPSKSPKVGLRTALAARSAAED